MKKKDLWQYAIVAAILAALLMSCTTYTGIKQGCGVKAKYKKFKS